MIVYDNLNGKTVSQILAEHGDDLRTEHMVLKYDAENDVKILLVNTFDIPALYVFSGDEEVTALYPSVEDIDSKFASLVGSTFGEYTEKPYSEWLWLCRRSTDEEKTRRELMKFLRDCGKRSLSAAFKDEMKSLVLAM